MRSWTQPNLQQTPHEMPPSDPAFAEKWFNFVVAEAVHHHEQAANGR